MSHEIKVPQIGESISEATIAAWNYEAGARVEEGAELAELETDKVNLPVPAPFSGVLIEILATAGATVKVGEIIARMEESAAPEKEPPVVQDDAMPLPQTEKNEILPPGARRLAAEAGLQKAEISSIEGSGKREQVLKSDVEEFIAAKSSGGATVESAIESAGNQSADGGSRSSQAHVDDTVREKAVPMSRLRKRIAERLLEAQRTAAILSTFNEIDMSAIMDVRRNWKEAFKKKYDTNLGFMSFFVQATVAALKEFPAINAEIRGDDIIYKNYQDIGVAVGGPKGLVVPVLRNAQDMSFAEIEAEITRLAGRVQDGSIALSEMLGGTFTISNGGVYGSMLSTPILNPPQSGILGMHNIVKRPMVVDDAIEIRPMMYVALSYDHRIVDGSEAVRFLVRLKQSLENPERMLLGI